MLAPKKFKSHKLLLALLPVLAVLLSGTSLPTRNTYDVDMYQAEAYCTRSARQIVYTSEADNPIVTYKTPMLAGKTVYVNSVDVKGDTVQSVLSTKDVSLILDEEAEMPGFIVFNKRGKPYCSIEMGLLDFPDYFSYRCLTKDRKVVTAGILKSQPIDPNASVRKLVNDNINKEDLPVLLTDNIVIECYASRNWLGITYTINVNVSPLELSYYKDDIISMLKQGYAKMDNATALAPQDGEAEEPVSENQPITEYTETTTPEIAVATETAVATEKNEDNRVAETPEPETTEAEPRVSEPRAEAEIPEAAEPEEAPKNLGAREMPEARKDMITEEDKEEIQREAEDKLYRLQDCFDMLSNRNYSAQQKKRERETTVQDLFINDRANVGVSSVNTDVIKNYLIGEYLLRLERMISAAYQKVEIVFSEIYKVSNFKPNPDGTWSATVTFSQEFRGFTDIDGKQLAYSDITEKSVTVKIRRVELFTGNSTPDVYWEVLLADIGVNQTRPF